MKFKPQGCWWSLRSTFLNLIGTGAVAAGVVSGIPAFAQVAYEPGKLQNASQAVYPPLQERLPWPQKGEAGTDSMFGLSVVDAQMEIVVGHSRLITLEKDIATPKNPPGVNAVVAVGNPGVVEFDVLNSRVIRLVGTRLGSTEISILTADNTPYVIKIEVIYDLPSLRKSLSTTFPEASLEVNQVRESLVVKGEARDVIQVRNILEMLQSYLTSVQAFQAGRVSSTGSGAGPGGAGPGQPDDPNADPNDPNQPAGDQPGAVTPLGGGGGRPSVTGQIPAGTLVNLIRIPTNQQVLLKCKIAEVQRTALRAMGFNFNWNNSGFGFTSASGTGMITGTTLGGADMFSFTLNALRQNNVARVLAEPNLVTLSGHQANFLSGGRVPVPVPQAGGGVGAITIQYERFGTLLNFTPVVLDRENIRLTVSPEVSALSAAGALTTGGVTAPAFASRSASTTVEMRQGQTLAIAGLMQLTTNYQTNRIPGVGDIPYLGALFRTNAQPGGNGSQETEIVIAVTPYLIEPMNPNQVPRYPGDEIHEPNDFEFYLLGRIEGRLGRNFRSATRWDDPLQVQRMINLEKKRVHGNTGFSD